VALSGAEGCGFDPRLAYHFRFCFPLKILSQINGFWEIRLFNRLGHVVGIWVKSPLKPEQKPEHGGGTDENGVLERLAWGFDVLTVKSYIVTEKTWPDPFPPDFQTIRRSTSSIGSSGSDTQSAQHWTGQNC